MLQFYLPRYSSALMRLAEKTAPTLFICSRVLMKVASAWHRARFFSRAADCRTRCKVFPCAQYGQVADSHAAITFAMRWSRRCLRWFGVIPGQKKFPCRRRSVKVKSLNLPALDFALFRTLLVYQLTSGKPGDKPLLMDKTGASEMKNWPN